MPAPGDERLREADAERVHALERPDLDGGGTSGVVTLMSAETAAPIIPKRGMSTSDSTTLTPAAKIWFAK
jgi:hypothetical protein